MIKFLLKIEPLSAEAQATQPASGDWTDSHNGHINAIDACTLDPMKLANIEKKIEADPDKLDAALSIYNDCPTTLNKILLSTKNPIIVDTSHQPGLLVLSSSSSASVAMTTTTTTNPSSLSSTSPTSNASNSSAKSTPGNKQQSKQQATKQLGSYKSVSSLLSSRSSSVVSTGSTSVKTTPSSATKANRKQAGGSLSVSYSKANKSKTTTGNDEQQRRDRRDVKERERAKTNGIQKSLYILNVTQVVRQLKLIFKIKKKRC